MNEEYLCFKLPSYEHHLKCDNIQLSYTLLPNENNAINESLFLYLNEMKHMIKDRPEWSKFKIYTNPYEFIHTSYDNINTLTNLHPISRSFFKLIELQYMCNIISMKDGKLRSLHMAEGPGGFIEATYHLRSKRENDVYTGVTLQSNDQNVPKWNKIRQKYDNVKQIVFDDLQDETGNLYHVCNFMNFVDRHKYSMDFITADGGFDFSFSYRHQEQSILRLLLTQVMYALMCQKKGGNFVMKLFDVFTQGTVDIIYMLNTFYGEVYLCKPFTSRFANSERYIVCKQFRYRNIDHLYGNFLNVFQVLEDNKDFCLERILNIPIHDIFVRKIENINSIFGQNQIEAINNTLMLIDHSERTDMLEYYKRVNLTKCIRWCIAHNIEYLPVQKINMFNNKVTVDTSYEEGKN